MADPSHVSGDGAGADELRLLPGQYPASPVLASADGLREPYHPFFDVQWSLGLRGTYTTGTEGDRFDTRLVPEVSLDHAGSRSTISLEGSAEVVRSENGQIDVSELRLGLGGEYALDSATDVSADLEFSLTQDIAGTPGIDGDIVEASQAIEGSAAVTIDRQLGVFNVALSGVVARNVYGESALSDGTDVDNSDENYWSTDGILRVGYQATPIFEVFGEAGLGRDMFDSPSSTNAEIQDATDSTLRAGVSANWNDILEASVSTGIAMRRFDAEGLGSLRAQIYDASLRFAPDPTLALTGAFTTTLEPSGPDGPGSARVEYEASAEASYTVNAWLALRAGAAWNFGDYTDSTDVTTGYDLSAGADYQLNRQMALNADYEYGHSDSESEGTESAHRVSLGVTVSR
jgi:hypothetical protein